MPLQTPEQVLVALAETHRRIAAVTADVSEIELNSQPSPEAWSAGEVLAHLRSCSDVWGGCIVRILKEDAPTIRAVNPRTWIENTDYARLEFFEHLSAFAAQRAELLAVLQPLAPSRWRRKAVVTGAGRTLERTVVSYAEWLASHERPHIKQIERAIRTMQGGSSNQ